MKGKDTLMPTFDFREKRRVVSKTVKSSSSGVVSIPISSGDHNRISWYQLVSGINNVLFECGSCYFLCLL